MDPMQITEARLFELIGRLYVENQVLRDAATQATQQPTPAGNGTTTPAKAVPAER